MTTAQIVVPTGSIAPGTVLTALSPGVPSQQPSKAEEEEAIVLHSHVSTSFQIIGIACILLCTTDLIVGIIALIYGSVVTYSFSWAWSGFLFGIINGALVLRAGKNKPQIDLHWSNVTFGFGITTIIFHSIDLILAAVGIEIYGETYNRKADYGSHYTINFYFSSPINAEATRFVLLLLIVSLEIWQVSLGNKLRRHFARQYTPPPVSFTVLTLTQPVPTAVSQNGSYMPNVPPPSYQADFHQPNS